MPILTLAILADDNASWCPNHYQKTVWGHTVLTFQFLINKLLDFARQEAALLAMENPFGTIVVASLAALKTRPNLEARYEQKFKLTRLLYEKGLGRDAILNL